MHRNRRYSRYISADISSGVRQSTRLFIESCPGEVKEKFEQANQANINERFYSRWDA